MKRIVLMGPPGVGKGTQAARLAASLGVPAISTGDLFREHVSRSSALGLEVKGLLASGSYVPDSVTNAMVAERLDEPDAAAGFILDGYPRTLAQVAELDRLLDTANVGSIDAVIVLHAHTDEIVTRLLARAKQLGRSDDTPDVIIRRIQTYESETAPLATRYERRSLLFRVDGLGAPDVVQERIGSALSISAHTTIETQSGGAADRLAEPAVERQ